MNECLLTIILLSSVQWMSVLTWDLWSWIEGSKEPKKFIHIIQNSILPFQHFCPPGFLSWLLCKNVSHHIHVCHAAFTAPNHLPWVIAECGQKVQCSLCRGFQPSLAGPLSTLTSCSVCPDPLTFSLPLAASTCAESPTQSHTHTIRLPPLFNHCSESFNLNCLHFALPGSDLCGHSTQSLPSSWAPALHTGRIACQSLFQSVFAFMCT